MVSLEAIVPRVNGLAIIDPLAKFTAADRIDAEEGLFIDKAVVFLALTPEEYAIGCLREHGLPVNKDSGLFKELCIAAALRWTPRVDRLIKARIDLVGEAMVLGPPEGLRELVGEYVDSIRQEALI